MKKFFLLALLAMFTQVNAQQSYSRICPTPVPVSSDIAWSEFNQSFYLAVTNGVTIGLMQLDTAGNIIKHTAYAPGMYSYESVDIEVRSDGTVYISGQYGGYNTVTYYILAVDPSGNVLWSKSYTTSSMIGYDHSKFKILDNGDLLIIESLYGKMGFIKTDANGTLLSCQTFREDTTAENKTPGFSGDVFPDGSFIFTGKRTNDIAVVRTDVNGNILWTSVMNAGMEYYHTKDVLALDDGSSVICGFSDLDPFLMRIDASGTMMWYNVISGSGGSYYALELLNDTTVVALGMLGGGTTLTRMNLNGDILGSVYLVGSNFSTTAYNFAITPTGTIAVPANYAYNAVQGMGLFIMENNSPFDCARMSATLTLSTTGQDPSVIAQPLYRVPEVILVNQVSVLSGQLSGNTTDFCSLVSVGEEPTIESNLLLQGNPLEAGSALQFSLGTVQSDIEFQVTDALGRCVVQNKLFYAGGVVSADRTDQLAPGVYLFTVVYGDRIETQKFIVR